MAKYEHRLCEPEQRLAGLVVLVARKWSTTALMRLDAGASGILFSEALGAEGAIVFAKACELGLEGIVSKRVGSFYRAEL